MKYLLDTYTLSYFFKKETNVINHMRSHSPTLIAISVVTLHEIEYGLMLNSDREKKLRPIFENLINQITVINLDLKIAKVAAIIRADLKKRGNLIGAYDILIAATAIRHKLICITSNVKEFIRVSDLRLEDWKNL